MRRSGRKFHRRDQFLARPNTRKRIEPVCQSFSENDYVGRYIKILDRPKFPGAVKTHLDLVVNHQDLSFVEYLLEFFEVADGRDHVATRPLDGLDIKRRKLSFACLRI